MCCDSGSDAAPPDPRLIDAQIKSMGIQDDAIQGILDLSRNMQPLQQEQMRFGIDSARTAYDQAQADREWTLGRRDQLEAAQNGLAGDATRYGGRMMRDAQSFADQLNAFDTDARRDQLAGEAMGDASQMFGLQRGVAARELSRAGVNPSDGRFAGTQNQMAMAEAAAKAQAANKTREAARQEGMAMRGQALGVMSNAANNAFNMKSSAANMLAGYPAMGMQASGQGAQMAASGLGLANQGQSGMSAGYGAAGNMAGQMGQNATNMWGQQANFYTQNQSQDSLGGVLGGIGGLAMGLGKSGLGFSDRRLKKDVVLVGQDHRTGLNLYEFSYIDSDVRYQGVMADEVEAVMPEAVTAMPGGYKTVNYKMLGIEMKELA